MTEPQIQIPEFRTEEKFTTAVIDLFRMCGWWVHHDRGLMRQHIQGDVGFPDIFAVHPFAAHAVAAELKMPKGTVTEYQQGWLKLLGNVSQQAIQAYLWRPFDWPEIVRVARRK